MSATETATGAGGTVAVAAGAAKVGVTETPLRKLLVRMGIGLLMIGVFLSILYSHHWIVVAFVVLLQVSFFLSASLAACRRLTSPSLAQVASFRELIGVRFKEVKEQQLPFFRTLSWFAFCICEFAAYGRQVCNLSVLSLNFEFFAHFFLLSGDGGDGAGSAGAVSRSDCIRRIRALFHTICFVAKEEKTVQVSNDSARLDVARAAARRGTGEKKKRREKFGEFGIRLFSLLRPGERGGTFSGAEFSGFFCRRV